MSRNKDSAIMKDSAIEAYKETVKSEGENIIKHEFPKKFVELNSLLESDKFALGRISQMSADINIPCPEAVLLVDDGGEPAAKRRREEEGSKVLLLPNGPATTNPKLCELIDIIKPQIVGLIEHANKIKMWITYNMPRIEDGNNFGVSIQEETLSEARQVESEAATYLDQISRYFMTRGKIIAKVAKYPHVADIRRTVAELDEKEFFSLRLILHELRNNYVSLHDLITKNLDKIKKPRSSNTENLY